MKTSWYAYLPCKRLILSFGLDCFQTEQVHGHAKTHGGQSQANDQFVDQDDRDQQSCPEKNQGGDAGCWADRPVFQIVRQVAAENRVVHQPVMHPA